MEPEAKRAKLSVEDIAYLTRLNQVGVPHLTDLRKYAVRPTTCRCGHPPGFHVNPRSKREKPPDYVFRHHRNHKVICTEDRGWVPTLADFCLISVTRITPEMARRMIAHKLANPPPVEILDRLIPYIRDHDVQESFLGYVYEIIMDSDNRVMLCHRNQDPETANAWPDHAIWFGSSRTKIREALCRQRDWDNPGHLVEWVNDADSRIMCMYRSHLKPGVFNGGLTVGLAVDFSEGRIRGIREVTEDPNQEILDYAYGQNGELSGARDTKDPWEIARGLRRWIQGEKLMGRKDLVKQGEDLIKRVAKEVEEYKARQREISKNCKICPKVLAVYDLDKEELRLKNKFDEVSVSSIPQSMV